MSLNRSELRSWLMLMTGVQSLLDALDRQLRDDAGISHDDYRILGSLYRSPNRVKRMRDLAREMSYSPSRLTHAATRLESHGWVSRSKSNSDGRGVEVHLTDLGVAKAREASEGHLELVRQLVFDTQDPDQLDAAVVALARIGEAAETSRA
ncbi:MAG TPA: MarR family transcriptional regulator [Acidimicrobiia bacterium]|nr:MarR family transcriptional regulator [Acidimicrobiia bacterium]